MSSGNRRAVNGSFVATGAAGQQILTLLFSPRKVELLNTTTKARGIWIDSMPNGALFKDVDTGTGTEDEAYVTTGGVTPVANGFQVDTDAFFNAADVIFYRAEE
jgi:hypothetical protein